HIVLAVNKMDLVNYDQAVFDQIVADYKAFATKIGIKDFTPIPISGLAGYSFGQCAVLRNNALNYRIASRRHNADIISCTDFAGTYQAAKAAKIQIGSVDPLHRHTKRLFGCRICVDLDRFQMLNECGAAIPAGRIGFACNIVAGQSVTLTFNDEVDCSRGDVVALADNPPAIADRFEATLVWMSEEPLVPRRGYWLKIGTQIVSASIQPPKYQIGINTLEHLAAKTLDLNAIGVCTFSTDKPITFESYADNKTLGGFVLIDKMSNNTVAAGMINFSLRRAHNIHWQAADVDREAHASLKDQQPKVLWFTGLSGSGKSTIANEVEKRLHAMGKHTFLLDGDNVRHGLNKDLGFTDTDRIENIRRIGEVAKLMTDAGLIVLTAFISPFRSERQMVREMMPAGEFVEIHIDTPLDVAEARDVKGLYKKAREGTLKNFTGIDSPYEAPEDPEIRIDTTTLPADEAADKIISMIFDN
ncbi:MAG: adenylyl-sulfate kinase, partial [Pseudomonadota bacterium]|nr:adenylyl-sulfate kinase [Pseudomonadota bacterium]